MPRCMPVSLIALGLLVFVFLSLPLFEPGLFWLFAFNPSVALVWNMAAVAAAALIVSGVLWSVVRRRRAGR